AGGERREYPRIAGVSSFGAGGSNAHVVIEEYLEEKGQISEAGLAALVVLSGKSEAQLKEQVENLQHWLEEQRLNEEELANVAYTLQVGREAMEQRVGLLVTSLEELKAKLRRYLEGEQGIEDLYRGEVKRNKETLSVFVADEELQEAIAKWIERGKYAKLLDLWVKGLVFDWSRLYGERKPKRIALPTYPFARERYWLPEKNLSAFTGGSFGSALHPLLHLNTSDLHGVSYRSRFLGEEFFLADHVVQGQRMLPGAAHLEMARAAVKRSSGIEEGFGIEIRDVVWSRPVVVGVEPVDVHIGLYPQESGEIEYEVYSEDCEDECVVHSQGVALVKERREVESIDIEQMRRQCGGEVLSGAECYEAFRRMGIVYGSGHQGLKEIGQGCDEQGRRFVLGRLEIPDCIAASGDEYELHPSIVDAAFQATIGWMVESREQLKSAEGQKAALPFALENLEILRATPKQGWVILREGAGSGERVKKLDIDICEEDGRLCARLRGFSARLLERLPEAEESTGTILFHPQWKSGSPATGSSAQPYGQRLVLLCEMEEISKERLAELSGARVLNLKQEEESIWERFYGYAKALTEMFKDLLRAKPKDPVLVQLVIPHDDGEEDLLFGLKGILQTAGMESPKIVSQVVQVERGESAGELLRKLEESRDCIEDRLIRYQDGERKVLRFAELEAGAEAAVPVWKSGGVYLITGGAGGLGLLFAKEIAQQAPGVRLVLSGRSVLSQEKEQELEAIAELGAEVEYLQADVADRAAVEELLAKIRERYGKLDGILHSAGVVRDSYLLRKRFEELEEVLSPKVKGVVNLDESSRDQELDLFVLFSSISGAFGNVGQADYAAANGFLDEYAAYRNRLVQEGKRRGRTISINWPLWADGGMQMGAARMGEMQQHGFIPLSTQSGIAAFYQVIASLQSQLLVVAGDKQKVRKIFGIEASETKQRREQPVEPARGGTEPEAEALALKASQYMKKLVGTAVKLPLERVEVDAPLEKYGLDSILVMRLTQELEQSFGGLSKTLLFEYQTIQELTQYFLSEHKEQLKKILGLKEGAGERPTEAVRQEAVEVRKTRGRGRRRGGAWRKAVSARATAAEGEEIAIIGLSGRYPQARNLREYWENLKAGRDCITEIPAERWDHRLYFDAEKGKAGKSYSKWGGFLEGVDEFDPLFFNISPRDAEIMDPQERLFLECVYEAIEDAGYTRESLGRYRELGLEGNVGVFVGVMYEEYQLYGAQAQAQGQPLSLPGNPSSIANRVSYVCNFHGPSMAIDTMCSSSLTAIHLACQSLQRGGCEVAVAGGVNVSIHPNKYIALA
ncbi:MAG: SDR family NAD(P)-dependent oxidoreductase, partial [Ktedonobacteraceae bacterium]|nr:SDR family NAD(P)-dependent oxidoreductase [Ktedonobacteraceae bacterium]